MKATRLFLSMLAVAFLAVGCGEEKPGPDEPVGPGGDPTEPYEGVTIKEMITGDILAGDPGAITISGEGFDELDYVCVGWTDETGELVTERVTNESLEIRPRRISFGLHTSTEAKGQDIVVYLDREDYDYMMPISGTLHVNAPKVEDGYIPDPLLFDVLYNRNPGIAEVTGSCGLIDVEAAAELTTAMPIDYPGKEIEFPLYFAWINATDFSGLELFGNIGAESVNIKGEGANIVAWYCKEVKEVDFSKWETTAKVRIGNSESLESIICGPNMAGIFADNCKSLKRLDFHVAKYATRCDIQNCNVSYLDIRRCREGSAGYYVDGGDYLNLETTGSFTMHNGIADNATILIDSRFLYRHYVPKCWEAIIDAWKRGAKIEVYSQIKIEEKLGDVPMYKDQPDALSETDGFLDENTKNYYSTNKFKLDDPYTDFNEASTGGTLDEDVVFDMFKSQDIKPGSKFAITITGQFKTTDQVVISPSAGAKFEYVPAEFFTLTTNKITIATPVNRIGQSVTYGIKRQGFDVALSERLNVVAPTVAEGFIPDSNFRNALLDATKNPVLSKLFDACGILDTAKAKAYIGTKNGTEITDKNQGYTGTCINVSGCGATSFEGIEIFENARGTANFENCVVEELDLTGWNAPSVYVDLAGCENLTIVRAPKYCSGLWVNGCQKLEKVYAGGCNWLYSFRCYNGNGKLENLTYLDIRQLRVGTALDYTTNGPEKHNITESVYCTIDTDQTSIKPADNCRILVDKDFLVNKVTGGRAANADPYAFGSVYNAWKNGAQIDVFKSDDINEFLGSVPAYADDPTALGYTKGTDTWPVLKGEEVLISGNVKAGLNRLPVSTSATGTVYASIDGGSFDVYPTNLYTLSGGKLTLGFHVDKVGHTLVFKVGSQNVTGNITVVAPEVSEGYISDPVLRSKLASYAADDPAVVHPSTFFDASGMVDPAKAKAYSWVADHPSGNCDMFSSSGIVDFSGLALFDNLMGSDYSSTRVLALWACNSAKKFDLSGYKGTGRAYINNNTAVEEIIIGPNVSGLDMGGGKTSTTGCPNLKIIDISRNSYIRHWNFMECPNGGKYPLVLLDVRMPGEYSAGRFGYGGLYTVQDYTKLTVKMTDAMWDLHYTGDRYWQPVFEAWKKGATMEVYDQNNISRLLGTVPAYDGTNESIFPVYDKTSPQSGAWHW